MRKILTSDQLFFQTGAFNCIAFYDFSSSDLNNILTLCITYFDFALCCFAPILPC